MTETKLQEATIAYIDEDYQKALPLLVDLADRNNPQAQFLLALMYRDGDGVEKSEFEARKWINEIHVLADSGNVDAQWLLGRKYQYGDFVLQDNNKALDFYLSSAQGGNSDAQFHLSRLYEQGECGHTVDIDAAGYWLKLAVDQEHPEACYTYFMKYVYDSNVPYTKDLSLLELSSNKGFEPAQELILKMASKDPSCNK